MTVTNVAPARVLKVRKALCLKFMERSEAMGYKGVRRDQMALEFFCGAATMAAVLEDEMLEKSLTLFTAFAVVTRGFGAVEKAGREEVLE